MRTETEIRNLLKSYKKSLKGCGEQNDSPFLVYIDLLKWVLNEE